MMLDQTEEIKSANTFSSLITDLNTHLKQFASCVNKLSHHIENDKELDFKKGISFLTMKNMLMVEYLTNMMQLCNVKTSGLKLSGHPCVNRLAETRCVSILFFKEII